MDKVRIDKYLWAIRIFRTRTKASTACEQHKIKLNGQPVKAGHAVALGERYEVKTASRKWVIEVSGLLDHRVAYKEAIKYYVDITPEEEKQYNAHQAASFYTGKRLSKIGRPTKKQRRNWDDFWSEME